jgi:chromosome segregation ATPase
VILSWGELSVLKDFAISFLGLGLPAILVSFASITGMHYWGKRRKKNLKELTDQYDLPPQSSILPPLTAIERKNAIKKIRKQLSGFRAKQVLLKHDYLQSIRNVATTNYRSNEKNEKFMENIEEKMIAYEKQIAEMQSKIDMLETMPPPMTNEAHYLREMLTEKENEIQNLRAASNGIQSAEAIDLASKENLLNEQKEKINRLEIIVEEQVHLNDLLGESREQLNFVQNQLEQRIKANKVLEQRMNSVAEELSQSQFEFHEAGKKIINTANVLELKENEIGQLRLELDTKENELRQLKEDIHAKNEQLIAVENSYNEILRENDQYKTAITNDHEFISSLNRELSEEKQKNEHLQEQVRHNRRLLNRFYQELKSSVEETEKENEPHLLIGA